MKQSLALYREAKWLSGVKCLDVIIYKKGQGTLIILCHHYERDDRVVVAYSVLPMWVRFSDPVKIFNSHLWVFFSVLFIMERQTENSWGGIASHIKLKGSCFQSWMCKSAKIPSKGVPRCR